MSRRDLKFISPDSWGDIQRGWIYESAIPFIGERPLSFFHRDSVNKSQGTVAKNNGDFKPGNTYEIILPLKQRKVVVISNDDICHNKYRINVTVAPILSIADHEKKENWYRQAKEGTHPFFVYLPEDVTGRESIIVVSDLTTIHKNMLLNDKKDINEYMPVVESKLEYCFQLGIYSKHVEAETGSD
jgi:hypothetical protein